MTHNFQNGRNAREEFAWLAPSAKSELLRAWLERPLSRARSKRFLRRIGKSAVGYIPYRFAPQKSLCLLAANDYERVLQRTEKMEVTRSKP